MTLISQYNSMLQESIQHFLTQLKSGISNFTHFESMFSRLIYTIDSPPIEIIWFYTAVNYHTYKNMTKSQNLGQIICLNELFNSLVSCSSSCRSVHRIAVLAPLVFELHYLIIDSNLDNIVRNEISFLVDRLVSYISLCCCEGVNDHDESRVFSSCFVDLIKVWTVERRGNGCRFEDDFRLFFPVVSDEGRDEIWGRGEVGVLAGFVMSEVFLISVCLKLGEEKDVVSSTVDTITGFKSCYFFDALLKTLLEPSLPVTSLLTATDRVVLQEVLFDAIVLVDYPFFNPSCGICLCNHHLNHLASTWLFVADRATLFVRNNNGKVVSYMKAFAKSLINSQLIAWVSAQIGMVEDANKPKFSTPRAFLDWLVQLRGVDARTFNDEFSLFLNKATRYYKSQPTSNLPVSDTDQKVVVVDGIHRDLEMIDSTDAVKSDFKSNFSASEACRKRKGEKDEDIIRAKLLKYHVEGRPINNFPSFQAEVGMARRG